MGRGEGGGFRMGSTCIPEIFLILKIKKWKKKKFQTKISHSRGPFRTNPGLQVSRARSLTETEAPIQK